VLYTPSPPRKGRHQERRYGFHALHDLPQGPARRPDPPAPWVLVGLTHRELTRVEALRAGTAARRGVASRIEASAGIDKVGINFEAAVGDLPGDGYSESSFSINQTLSPFKSL
jgi:hypothetical protein